MKRDKHTTHGGDKRWEALAWSFLSCSVLSFVACREATFSPTVSTVAVRLQVDSIPSSVFAGVRIAPAISISLQDANGHRALETGHQISLSVENAAGHATLSGALIVTAENGVAAFADVRVDSIGDSLRFVASTPGLVSGQSSFFKTAPASVSLSSGVRGLAASVSSVLATGAAWGELTALRDGSVGLVYQRATPVPKFGAANISIEYVRSTDGGRTWSKPVIVHQRVAADGSPYDRSPNGESTVYQSRNTAFGQLPSGRIICAVQLQDYIYSSDGVPITQPLGGTWIHRGIVYQWSDDLGASWSPPHQLPEGPFKGQVVVPNGPVVSDRNGVSLLSVYGFASDDPTARAGLPKGTVALSAVLRSIDNGQSWGDFSPIFTKDAGLPYEETSLLYLGTTLHAFVRTEMNYVAQLTSPDYGRTWSSPTQVTEVQQLPGTAVALRDGVVLLSWGNRRAPFGAQLMLSRDGGVTWDRSTTISIGWECANQNCGYANAVQMPGGDILLTYYSMPSGVPYAELWAQGKVYLVRFTEDALLAALRER